MQWFLASFSKNHYFFFAFDSGGFSKQKNFQSTNFIQTLKIDQKRGYFLRRISNKGHLKFKNMKKTKVT